MHSCKQSVINWFVTYNETFIPVANLQCELTVLHVHGLLSWLLKYIDFYDREVSLFIFRDVSRLWSNHDVSLNHVAEVSFLEFVKMYI